MLLGNNLDGLLLPNPSVHSIRASLSLESRRPSTAAYRLGVTTSTMCLYANEPVCVSRKRFLIKIFH